MSIRKKTKIENAFSVDSIVTVLLHKWQPTEVVGDSSVIYDFWQLIYIDEGEYCCRINGQEFSLRAGQVLLCEPDHARITVARPTGATAFVSFGCRSDKMDALKNTVLTLSEHQKALLSRLLSMGTEKFTMIPDNSEFYGQEPRSGTFDYELQTIKNLLELLIIDFYQSLHPSGEPAASVHKRSGYCEQQFRSIDSFLKQSLFLPLSVRQIAEHTGLSSSTVNRVTQRQIGCGVIHYFQTLKIREAKKLICETDMNFTQISDQLGFSDIHYFSRAFKRITGVSPREYARSIREQT